MTTFSVQSPKWLIVLTGCHQLLSEIAPGCEFANGGSGVQILSLPRSSWDNAADLLCTVRVLIRFGALWSHLNKKSCQDGAPVLESNTKAE
jgi:hypothetical protein